MKEQVSILWKVIPKYYIVNFSILKNFERVENVKVNQGITCPSVQTEGSVLLQDMAQCDQSSLNTLSI